MANKKPSIKMISEITGFSPATVSNALNNKRGVNKDTAERIFQVAGELGYSFSKGLQSIIFVHFRRDGQVVDDSSFHHSVIEGVEAAARENGLSTQYIRLDPNTPDYSENVNRIVTDPTGGVILLATEMQEEDFIPFQQCKAPVILLDGWCYHQTFNGVLINNIDPIVEVVDYLIKKGHKRIGYIRGKSRIKAFLDREIGYEHGLIHNGLNYDREIVVDVGTKTDTAFYDMQHWLDEGHDVPTAFIAENDLMAFGAIRALKASGYNIPDDVSIVGFDDLTFSSVSSPALSTVRVHKRSMGWEAVRRLLFMMDSPNASCFKVESCTDFIERESVRDLTI